MASGESMETNNCSCCGNDRGTRFRVNRGYAVVCYDAWATSYNQPDHYRCLQHQHDPVQW